MKKLPILLLVLFISTLSIAQDKSASIDSVIQLIEINDGTNTFNDILEWKLKNATVAEQMEFQNKIRDLVTKKKAEIKVYFSKKFTQKEISDIYKELNNSCLIAYSQRTVSFTMEWRTKRRELNKDFNKIYDSYR